MNIHTRIAIEKAIYARIVQDALIMGYRVSVYNGDDHKKYELEQSSDYFDIIGAGYATDYDKLYFHNHIGQAGWVFLVYGNDGWDLINDYVATPEIEAILKGAEDLANYLERIS
jgi:hypothetical protein